MAIKMWCKRHIMQKVIFLSHFLLLPVKQIYTKFPFVKEHNPPENIK